MLFKNYNFLDFFLDDLRILDILLFEYELPQFHPFSFAFFKAHFRIPSGFGAS